MVFPSLKTGDYSRRLVHSAVGFKVATGVVLAVLVATCQKPVALAPTAALLALTVPVLPGTARRWLRSLIGVSALVVTSAAVIAVQGWRSGIDPRQVGVHLLLIGAKLVLLTGLSAALASCSTPYEVAAAIASRCWRWRRYKIPCSSFAVTLTFTLYALPVFATFIAQARDAARLRLFAAKSILGYIRLMPFIARSAYRHATAWGNNMAEAILLRGCRTTEAWLKTAPRRPPAVGVLLTGAVVAATSLALELWS